MKLKMVLAMSALALLAGCSKCSQQPTADAPPPVEGMAPTEPATVEGASAENMPNSEQLNEELPPGDAEVGK